MMSRTKKKKKKSVKAEQGPALGFLVALLSVSTFARLNTHLWVGVRHPGQINEMTLAALTFNLNVWANKQ